MTRPFDDLIKKRKELGNIGALDFLIDFESQKLGLPKKYFTPEKFVTYEPFFSKNIEVPSDLEKFKNKPNVLPKDFSLPPLKGLANDYTHLLAQLNKNEIPNVSIVVLTFNRCEPLKKTLTGIVNQNYDISKIEVIVVDDGSSQDTLEVIRGFETALNIKFFWHPNIGFTPSIARNSGVALAKNDFIILLDVDMYPGPNLVSSYVKYSRILDKTVLIGPRKYVDLNNISCEMLAGDKDLIENLPLVITNNEVAGKIEGTVSIDWRLNIFNDSNQLKNEKLPFRVFAAGNVAFSKEKFLEIGGFDERFRAWGYEDGELAFRFFNNGAYMIPVMDAWAYHQEPPNGINETDRSEGKSITAIHYANVCPYYRHLAEPREYYEVPKVSIYIPAYNAEKTIIDAVESALDQTYKDLEVCICDDGSTDGTLILLETHYSNNPRVRWVTQKNGGIGAASNSALRLCRGLYIGQLDSDDILARDAVEKCVPFFEKDMKIGLVYTSYENQQIDGTITPGYNYPVFTREKLTTAMIAHHFRMFRRRDWARAGGFSERLKNAVDYDFYLKLSEVCEAHHLNIISYRRRLHGENTSIVNFLDQNKNAVIAVNESLKRQGLEKICRLESENSSKLIFSKTENPK